MHKYILILFVSLYGGTTFASEQTVCEANIEVTKTHELITTRSGRTLITADIKVVENTFSCKGLGKKNTKGMFEDILRKKTSIELDIDKKDFKTGTLYRAEYIYPDDLWYVTKRLDAKSKTSKGVAYHRGDLFSVYYPSAFTVHPDSDEATFLSPDKEVAFFVYSPHWTGKPKKYHNISKNETLVSKETKVNYPEKNRKITYTYVTLKAKDGSYMRSYVDILGCWVSADSCESTTFGIKYKNKKAYDRYKKAYIKFKKSLEKYAAS